MMDGSAEQNFSFISNQEPSTPIFSEIGPVVPEEKIFKESGY